MVGCDSLEVVILVRIQVPQPGRFCSLDRFNFQSAAQQSRLFE